ncbi:MAG: hypothetical protein FE834_04650 [Gammaproteobacteria bacterium]|nr:hypothetical protein [Gammaproteobacteria bacterium]
MQTDDNNDDLDIWLKIKPILEERDIDTLTFDINSECHNIVIIPSLITKIGEKTAFEVLAKTGHKIFQNETAIYSTDSFVICNNSYTYLTNPYNPTLLKRASMEAKQHSLIIDNIGIISEYSEVLGKQKKAVAEKTLTKTMAVSLLNYLVSTALNRGVTDIHMYPRDEGYVFFKFRVSGQLVESNIEDIGFQDYQLLANTMLNLSKKDPGVFSSFQEAKFDYITDNSKKVSIRLQMNPTIYQFPEDGRICPSFILRLHDTSKKSFISIDSLGLMREHQEILKKASQQNQGLILVSGPTGSGKTTALYAILAEITLARELCIQTIEDPVEVELPGVKQININQEAGVSYVNALKSVLRSDADVVLVGEIRDEITAQKSIELDKTGHLVLSTLHTKSSLSIIDRLRQFGVSNTDIADSLSVLVSSRLLPLICLHCSTEQKLSDDAYIMEHFLHKFSDLNKTIRVANKKGCVHCENGYSGRLLAAEVFTIDHALREMISNGSNQATMYQYIVNQNNVRTIWDHGLELLLAQKTSMMGLQYSLPGYIDPTPTKSSLKKPL